MSAQVHEGWYTKNIKNGVIPFKTKGIGGHAFAIVGYNDKGFFVQNSWSEAWGDKGIALWSYQDWRENISDAWDIIGAFVSAIIRYSTHPKDCIV